MGKYKCEQILNAILKVCQLTYKCDGKLRHRRHTTEQADSKTPM